MHPRNLTLALLGLLAAGLPSAAGQCRLPEEQVLIGNPRINLDQLGDSLDLDGNFAVAGAPGSDQQASNAGAAYVFRREGGIWVQDQVLLASDGSQSDAMGNSVAISGDRIVVGAAADSDAAFGAGSAYVFRYDGTDWVEEQKLGASDFEGTDAFGRAVDIDGSRILIGANGKDLGFERRAGVAYVFDFEGGSWQEAERLSASNPAENDFFGGAVSLAGDRALIGAEGVNGGGIDFGAAYVFEYENDQWAETRFLSAGDSTGSDLFGSTVSLAEGVACIGALRNDAVASSSGAAYVFRLQSGNWALEQKLVGSNTQAADFFATSVAIDNHLILVGAPGDDEFGTNTGSAFAFRDVGGHWVELAKLSSTTAANTDSIGAAVAIDGARGLVGVPSDDGSRGAALLYSLPAVALDVQPDDVQALDPIDLWSCGGVPASPTALFVTAVNGIPLTQMLLFTAFGADGRWTLSTVVPPGIPAGVVLTLQSFAVNAAGQYVISNAEELTFL